MSEVEGDSVRPTQPILAPVIQLQIRTGGVIMFPPSENQSFEGAVSERRTSSQPIISESRRRACVWSEIIDPLIHSSHNGRNRIEKSRS